MSDISGWRKALVTRILEGDGQASREQRRAAFDNTGLPGPLGSLVAKVAKGARTIRDEDIASARASGSSEDQIFEIVISAAVGEGSRQYDAALAALATASGSK
jgi:hypothetical protein